MTFKSIIRITFICGAFLMLTLLALNTVFAQETVEPENVNPFVDVIEGNSEFVAIKYLKDIGIIQGYPDGSFQPNKSINRVESLKIILEANKLISDKYVLENKLGGINFSSETALTFSDVFKSVWYYPYVKKGIEEGFIKGYEDNTFRPLNTVNRAESFKMVMSSDGINLPEVTSNPFADVNMYAWYSTYILEAKLREIIYFTMKNNAYPAIEMNRSKFAGLIYRYLQSKIGHKFGKASYYSDYFEGRGTASGEPYRGSEYTAAHLTLPFNTILNVTNVENGKSVIVRVNDRGPYINGRSIDLSKQAFQDIGYLGSGVIKVEFEILNEENYGG